MESLFNEPVVPTHGEIIRMQASYAYQSVRDRIFSRHPAIWPGKPAKRWVEIYRAADDAYLDREVMTNAQMIVRSRKNPDCYYVAGPVVD